MKTSSPAICRLLQLQTTLTPLDPIPDELQGLNVLERHVIAKFIPFAQIISLPNGQQRAIHRAVVCVSSVESTVECLPRPQSESQLLRVKMNRPKRISPSRYFNARVFSADDCPAMDTNYIFFAQFVTEMHLAMLSLSFHLRKGKTYT